MMNVKFSHLPFAILAAILLPLAAARAALPLLAFAPLTPTTLTVASDGTASVKYQVTNQGNATKVWAMQPIQGVLQASTGAGVCANPFTLTPAQSCLLDLQLDGSLIGSAGIHAGPVVCVQGAPSQCYQPSAADSLDVTVDETIFRDGFEPLP